MMMNMSDTKFAPKLQTMGVYINEFAGNGLNRTRYALIHWYYVVFSFLILPFRMTLFESLVRSDCWFSSGELCSS